MALTLVQKNPSGGGMERGTTGGSLSNYTMASAFGTNPASGSLIIVAAAGRTDGGTAAVTVTDASGTYTNAVTAYDSSGARWASISYIVASGGSVQPNIALAYAVEYNVVAYNYSDNQTSSIGDGTGTLNPIAHGGGSGTDTVSLSGATSNANDILISVLACRSNVATSSIATPSGWDGIDQHTSDGSYDSTIAGTAYRIVSATGSYSAAWVGTADGNVFVSYGAAIIAAFKGNASGGLVVNVLNGRGGGAAMPFAV